MDRSCPNCGYSAEGLPSDLCPECGLSYEEALARNPRSEPLPLDPRRIPLTLGLSIAMFVLISQGAARRDFAMAALSIWAVISFGFMVRRRELQQEQIGTVVPVIHFVLVQVLALLFGGCVFANQVDENTQWFIMTMLAAPLLVTVCLLNSACFARARTRGLAWSVLASLAFTTGVTAAFYLWHGRDRVITGSTAWTEIDGWRPGGVGPLTTRHAVWHGVVWLVLTVVVALAVKLPRVKKFTPTS